MVVLEDADIVAAARWGMWASCWNAGQSCAGTERVYVVEDVYHQFVEQAVIQAKQLSVGYDDEFKSPHHLGPLSNENQAKIVDAHLEDAVAKGAKILCGGTRDGLLMEATVIVDVDHSMAIMSEETFGPVMPIMKVKDSAEAIKYANQSEYGLGASVWGEVLHAQKVLKQIDAGTKAANDAMSHFAIPNLPFGGVKLSGTGRSHDKQDLHNFTLTESYMVSVPPLPFDPAVLLRTPGNYRIGEALLKTTFGVTPAQKLEPVQQALESQKAKRLFAKVAEFAGDKKVLGATAAVVGLGSLRVFGRKKQK